MGGPPDLNIRDIPVILPWGRQLVAVDEPKRGAMGCQAHDRQFDALWVYDNRVASPTGRRITLVPDASDADIRSAMDTAGFQVQKVSRREAPADPFRVLTSNGMMALRPAQG